MKANLWFQVGRGGQFHMVKDYEYATSSGVQVNVTGSCLYSMAAFPGPIKTECLIRAAKVPRGKACAHCVHTLKQHIEWHQSFLRQVLA